MTMVLEMVPMKVVMATEEKEALEEEVVVVVEAVEDYGDVRAEFAYSNAPTHSTHTLALHHPAKTQILEEWRDD